MIFLFCTSLNLSSQQSIYYRSSFGVGGNSFRTNHAFSSYSLFLNFSVEKNKNIFTLRTNYNSELGHTLTPSERENFNTARYNSKLWDVSILYGRTYRKKDWYFTSLSAGIGYYVYTQKSLVLSPNSGPHIYDAQAFVKINKFEGLGIALQHEQIFILDDVFGIGLNAFANINAKRSVVGVGMSFVFGNLR